ncbi:hypothetical protein FPD46_00605 [Campylobacter peloridis]|uniref:Uncharacterized protein n=1 Tax=Campylobacter peloridis TaxID=488546 RepID=A0A5C7DPI5_9BACT|nr:hypothetical protein [Campylobacter peloridis]TXE84769.1 hypothetical protein FPD46_00605 [Campylobacter peloridis]
MKLLIGIESQNNGLISALLDIEEDIITSKQIAYFNFLNNKNKLKNLILKEDNLFAFSNLSDLEDYFKNENLDLSIVYFKNELFFAEKGKFSFSNLERELAQYNAKNIKMEHFYVIKDENINNELEEWFSKIDLENNPEVISNIYFNCDKSLYEDIYDNYDYSFLLIGGKLAFIGKDSQKNPNMQIINEALLPKNLKDKLFSIGLNENNINSIFANFQNFINPKEDLISNYNNDFTQNFKDYFYNKDFNAPQLIQKSENNQQEINESNLFDKNEIQPSKPAQYLTRDEFIRKNKR